MADHQPTPPRRPLTRLEPTGKWLTKLIEESRIVAKLIEKSPLGVQDIAALAEVKSGEVAKASTYRLDVRPDDLVKIKAVVELTPEAQRRRMLELIPLFRFYRELKAEQDHH